MHPECLSDHRWREDNLDTLPEWHPCFHLVQPDVIDLVKQLAKLFDRYLDYMKQVSSDSPDDLLNHIEEEALTYFGNAVLAETNKHRLSQE